MSGHPANVRKDATQRGLSSRRGFTLVELLAVLAMVGILSVLALVGYRRYIEASRSNDARAVLAAIRVAEENYRAETLTYLECSAGLAVSGDNYYPHSDPKGTKRHWINPSHANSACWRMLNVVTDSPTRYGFAVVAGGPGDPIATPQGFTNPPTFPAAATEPWYVAQATGNNDDDATRAMFVTSSLSGEIYEENPDE